MSRVVVNFYQIENEDIAEQFHDVPIPPVGTPITVGSTRDNDGNYVHDRAVTTISGIVERVEFAYEERGAGPASHEIVTFAEVYVREAAALAPVPHPERASGKE